MGNPDSIANTGSRKWRLVLPALVLLASGYCTERLWNWERRALPGAVVIDAVLTSSSDGGFREGCSSVVYQLADSTVAAIEKQGLSYLETGGPPPDENPENRYGPWRETPGEIDLARNLEGAAVDIPALDAMGGCGSRSGRAFSRQIAAAVAKPGSFYMRTSNYEGIILVIPKERLAAYFYLG